MPSQTQNIQKLIIKVFFLVPILIQFTRLSFQAVFFQSINHISCIKSLEVQTSYLILLFQSNLSIWKEVLLYHHIFFRLIISDLILKVILSGSTFALHYSDLGSQIILNLLRIFHSFVIFLTIRLSILISHLIFILFYFIYHDFLYHDRLNFQF